jgi:hypothetical protein
MFWAAIRLVGGAVAGFGMMCALVFGWNAFW